MVMPDTFEKAMCLCLVGELKGGGEARVTNQQMLRYLSWMFTWPQCKCAMPQPEKSTSAFPLDVKHLQWCLFCELVCFLYSVPVSFG